MSLEAALHAHTEAVQANTVALTALLAAMAAGGVVTAPAAGAAGPEAADKPAGRGRGKKATDAAGTPAATGPDSNGNPAGTVYFYAEKQDSVYSRKPGDPEVTMEGGVEITAEQFKAHHDRLAAKYAAAQQAKESAQSAQSTPATTVDADPFDPFAAVAPATKQPVTQQQMIDKLMEVSKAPAKGREFVMKILAAVGAENVPSIPAAKYDEAFDLAVKALAA